MEQEPLETPNARLDLVLASVFTVAGLVAIVLGRGGLGNMIAGSVGTVGASVAAILFVASDGRLSYAKKAGASLALAFMVLGTGLSLGDNAFALVGYPLAALGLSGLAPMLLRAQKEAAPKRARSSRDSDTLAHG